MVDYDYSDHGKVDYDYYCSRYTGQRLELPIRTVTRPIPAHGRL